MKTSEIDVLVVGAGAVGLSAGLQLGRLGVRTLVVERRTAVASHPRAFGVHPRSMELFQKWGIAEPIRSAARPLDTMAFAWVTRMAGIELGSFQVVDKHHDPATIDGASPELLRFVSQNAVELHLLKGLEQQASTSILLDTAATLSEQDDLGATFSLAGAGPAQSVRARYVIAADGAGSAIRSTLGITETAEPPFGELMRIHFRSAGLTRSIEEEPYSLWSIINPDVQGGLWPVGGDEWIVNFDKDPARPHEPITDELCRTQIRQAAGDQALDVEVLSTVQWKYDQAVAENWRRGRIILAGDSAHRFPPHGGFGMNSGFQDTANLCWKLSAVLRGDAADALLDTYEAERKPVAEYNARQCMINTLNMIEKTGHMMSDRSALAVIEQPEGEPVRRRISEGIAQQGDMFNSQGQEFGYIYESAAIVNDATEPERSTVGHYRPTAHPGARAPHVWLKSAGGDRLSTIDLFGDHFTVLAGAQGGAWSAAAQAVTRRLGVEVRAHVVGESVIAERASFESVYGIEPSGAVLVRPDGHVAMRARAGKDDPSAELEAVLGNILARNEQLSRSAGRSS